MNSYIEHSSTYFSSNNPVIGVRVYTRETDTLYVKIGDGITDYNSLPYRGSVIGQFMATYPDEVTELPILIGTGIGSTPTLALVLNEGNLTGELPILSDNSKSQLSILNGLGELSFIDGAHNASLTMDAFELSIHHSSASEDTRLVLNDAHAKLSYTGINNTSIDCANLGIELIAVGLSPSTVPYLNSSSILTSSAVTPTELGYVSGVTSSIQTQINSFTTSLSGYLPLTGGTMSGNILFTGSKGIDTTAAGGTDTLNIGATNADVINIGRSGAIVNILGSALYEYAANQYVLDKLITLNYGGAASSGIGVGFEIEENSIITGYLKTNATRNGYSLLTPAIAFKSDILLASLTVDRVHTLPDLTGTFALTANKLSVFAATTSTELAGVISDETGSGSLVFATSPTLVTPTLGVATATSINKVVITAPATSSTLTIADSKTLTANNSITFAGTDGIVLNFPNAAGTYYYPLTQYPTGDQTSTSSTSAAITGLSFAMAANSIYTIDGLIGVGCNNTGGVVFDVTVPTSATLRIEFFGRSNSGSAFNRALVIAGATQTAVAFNTINLSGGQVYIRGTVTTVGTSGNFVIRFASGVNTQTSTIFQEGSFVQVKRIS